MRMTIVAGALALAGSLFTTGEAAAAPRDGARGNEVRGRCGARAPDAREQQSIDAALAAVDAAGGAVTIPVYAHVVTTSSGGGDVSALIPAQIAVLNAAYAGAGFSFRLDSVEVVANDVWFASGIGSAEEAEMKAALRQGGPGALNVYTTNADGYLGWATFPNYVHASPSYDGVVLYWATLPGAGLDFRYDRALEPDGRLTYDLGDTGTHEVGHWLGLYHTFQGGCANGGDQVKDTPAEAGPQFFCVPRDSCTTAGFPGADPIENFMDYVDDACMDRFSADQESRMRKAWRLFRG